MRDRMLPSRLSILWRGIGRSWAEDGLALFEVVAREIDDASWAMLCFCGRCESPPKRGSGAFLVLRSLKKDVLD